MTPDGPFSTLGWHNINDHALTYDPLETPVFEYVKRIFGWTGIQFLCLSSL